MSRSELSDFIRKEASALGFMSCGISKAGFLEAEAPRLEQWLKKGFHGNMGYMENHFDKRLNPTLLVEGAKSVVSLLLNYFPAASMPEKDFKISRYALGRDYHLVIKEKLSMLLEKIRVKAGNIHGRAFVDSAPVLDKAWAAKSGLGWIGKNANLINPKAGSYFFIAELIVDLDLETDLPASDHCGTCRKCLDACPTEAIVAPREVDASKCISYLTIELKEKIPDEFRAKTQGWAFGCDICQEVCPWNRFSRPNQEPAFEINQEIAGLNASDWQEITEEVFKVLAKESPLTRPGLEKLKDNIAVAANRTGLNQ